MVTMARIRYSPLDTGFSWVMLTCCFLLNLILNATAGSMGVLIVELMHHFDVKKSVIVWIGGILVSVGMMLSFFIGWLIKRFGCRVVGCISSVGACVSFVLASRATSVTHLYITYGFMLAIFCASYFNISNIVVQQYFHKRRTLAQGMLMAGLSAGLFIWPPFTRYLIDKYDWRGALFIHGGIQLHGVVFCAMIRPVNRPPTESTTEIKLTENGETTTNGSTDVKASSAEDVLLNGHSKDNGSVGKDDDGNVPDQDASHGSNTGHVTDQTSGTTKPSKGCTMGAKCFRSMFKVIIIFPHFILYLLALICVQTGNVMPYTLTPARADALGIDKTLGALLVSVSAGISGVCRIICGYIGDKPWVNRLVVCGVSGLVGGTLTALSVIPTTFLGLVIIFGIIALPSASFMSTFSSAAIDVVGYKYIQQAVGLMSVAFGTAQFTTFLVTGWLSDVLGDPKYGFLVFGILETLGGVLFLAAYIADKRFKLASAANAISTTADNNEEKTDI